MCAPLDLAQVDFSAISAGTSGGPALHRCDTMPDEQAIVCVYFPSMCRKCQRLSSYEWIFLSFFFWLCFSGKQPEMIPLHLAGAFLVMDFLAIRVGEFSMDFWVVHLWWIYRWWIFGGFLCGRFGVNFREVDFWLISGDFWEVDL